MLSGKSNSAAFIAAYNRIDKAIRAQYNFKASISFSDIVRQTATRNVLVAKYEDDLYDYARLRNAIVHKSYTDFVIAEPHDKVVENILHIAKLITTPPRVMDTVANTKVTVVQSDSPLMDAILIIGDRDISNIPVYEDTKLVGVINPRIITECIGRAAFAKMDLNEFLKTVRVGEILANTRRDHYMITDDKITVEEAIRNFSNNSKLQIILITVTGNFLGKPAGIISTGDILRMNRILEDY